MAWQVSDLDKSGSSHVQARPLFCKRLSDVTRGGYEACACQGMLDFNEFLEIMTAKMSEKAAQKSS